jgi:hypothetical protein
MRAAHRKRGFAKGGNTSPAHRERRARRGWSAATSRADAASGASPRQPPPEKRARGAATNNHARVARPENAAHGGDRPRRCADCAAGAQRPRKAQRSSRQRGQRPRARRGDCADSRAAERLPTCAGAHGFRRRAPHCAAQRSGARGARASGAGDRREQGNRRVEWQPAPAHQKRRFPAAPPAQAGAAGGRTRAGIIASAHARSA